MTLFESFMEPCVVVDRKTVSDGQGGYTTEWVDGAEIRAAIAKNSSLEARVAEKQGVTEVFTITTAKGLLLKYHDVLRRVSDGAIFRVTSNAVDSSTPKVASFQFEQVSAERWELPSDD